MLPSIQVRTIESRGHDQCDDTSATTASVGVTMSLIVTDGTNALGLHRKHHVGRTWSITGVDVSSLANRTISYNATATTTSATDQLKPERDEERLIPSPCATATVAVAHRRGLSIERHVASFPRRPLQQAPRPDVLRRYHSSVPTLRSNPSAITAASVAPALSRIAADGMSCGPGLRRSVGRALRGDADHIALRVGAGLSYIPAVLPSDSATRFSQSAGSGTSRPRYRAGDFHAQPSPEPLAAAYIALARSTKPGGRGDDGRSMPGTPAPLIRGREWSALVGSGSRTTAEPMRSVR